MPSLKFPCALLLVFFLTGCTPPPAEIVTTASPGVTRIPTTLALHPLLTSKSVSPAGHRTLEVRQQGRDIYLTPPAASELAVTVQSRMMTDMLSGELAYQGFSLKELPFEPVETGEDKNSSAGGFAISLDLLRQLRAEVGLEAVLVGNVFFTHDGYSGRDHQVKAAHCKLIDVQTLDILCHISLPPSDYGMDMTAAVTAIAAEMARLAGPEAD